MGLKFKKIVNLKKIRVNKGEVVKQKVKVDVSEDGFFVDMNNVDKKVFVEKQLDRLNFAFGDEGVGVDEDIIKGLAEEYYEKNYCGHKGYCIEKNYDVKKELYDIKVLPLTTHAHDKIEKKFICEKFTNVFTQRLSAEELNKEKMDGITQSYVQIIDSLVVTDVEIEKLKEISKEDLEKVGYKKIIEKGLSNIDKEVEVLGEVKGGIALYKYEEVDIEK